MAEDKLREDLIKTFQKEFPESPLEPMSESTLAEVPGWITTGNYAMNWIISKNFLKGLPLGRVIIFSGDPSSGKSMVALSMMREKSIDYIIYLDSEGGGASRDFATFLGIDPKNVLYSQIDTVEGLISRMRLVIDMIEKNKTKRNILMVVDSISMLSTEKELNPEAGADMGNRAKMVRSFFRQYIRKMQKLNICAVFTAHLTENIGGYGPSKVLSGGGTILSFAPSVEVRFTRINADSEVEQSAKGASLVKIRAEIVKSRLGTYGKRVKFDLDMERGLDPYAGLSDIMKDYSFLIPAAKDHIEQIKNHDIPKKTTGWWMFKSWDDPSCEALSKRLVDEKLTSEGKFREDKIKEWSRDVPWFMPEMQKLLDKALSGTPAEDILNTDGQVSEPSVLSENQTEAEGKKRSKKVTITQA